MSQTQGEKPDQAATERAEEVFEQLGQRIGHLAVFARQRIQDAAIAIKNEADRMDQPTTAPAKKSSQSETAQAEEAGKPATERAEEMVDRMGQRLGHFTSLASLQIQRVVARAREDAEDMWVEAQNIRNQNARKPQ